MIYNSFQTLLIINIFTNLVFFHINIFPLNPNILLSSFLTPFYNIAAKRIAHHIPHMNLTILLSDWYDGTLKQTYTISILWPGFVDTKIIDDRAKIARNVSILKDRHRFILMAFIKCNFHLSWVQWCEYLVTIDEFLMNAVQLQYALYCVLWALFTIYYYWF